MNLEYEEYFIDAPWGKIAVVMCGPRDGYPVVLLHGNQDSASTFFPLIEYLPKDLWLIMPEIPGCGKSTHFPGQQPLKCIDFVYPLKLTVDHLKLDKFIFIGHSYGMQIALLYSAIYPNKFSKVVSLDTIAYPPIEADQLSTWMKLFYETFYAKSTYKKMSAGPATNPKYTYEEALKLITSIRGLTESAGKIILERSLVPAEDGLYRFVWDLRMKLLLAPTFDIEYQKRAFGKIDVPYLTILSSESVDNSLHELMMPVVSAHVANNPYYRILAVKGNHNVHVVKPELIASYIVPFLNGEDNLKEEMESFISENKHFIYANYVNSKL